MGENGGLVECWAVYKKSTVMLDKSVLSYRVSQALPKGSYGLGCGLKAS